MGAADILQNVLGRHSSVKRGVFFRISPKMCYNRMIPASAGQEIRWNNREEMEMQIGMITL